MTQRYSQLDLLAATLYIYNADIARAVHQHVAIFTFERRNRNHHALVLPACVSDRCCDGTQPWPAILVLERVPSMHLGDVFRWMKPISVFIGPAQPYREQGSDRAFAGAGDTHDNDECRLWFGFIRRHSELPGRRHNP